jgi:hypothetical protein
MAGPQDKNQEDRDVPSRSPEEEMTPRGSNVGQSGRWRRADGTEHDEVARRYGNEEKHHATEDGGGSSGGVEEDLGRAPDHRNASSDIARSGRRSVPRGEPTGDQDAGETRYESSAYGEAGGKGGEDPPAGSEEWQGQSGAGYGEDYGVGRDPAEGELKKR